MSNLAKDKINAIKAAIENDMRVLTHPDDRKAYVDDLREQLARINAAAKRSPHDKHTHAAD